MFEDLTTGDDTLPDIEIKSTDPMAIVYTGGSTSMPKGVLVSHLYYIGAAIRYAEIAEATENDVHFANSHFFHIGGQQFAITGPLYTGMTGIMEKWFSASRYWDICRKYDVTIVDPIGTMMAVLLRQPPQIWIGNIKQEWASVSLPGKFAVPFIKSLRKLGPQCWKYMQ